MKISFGGVIALLLALLPVSASAAQFTVASLRLERAAIGQTDVQYLVVAQPATSDTEAKLTLTFANAFGVDSVPANITASASGLPATFGGSTLTAWPGIGSTASSVSGQAVTFASSDLSAGTLYGFFITAGIDNPSAAETYTVTLQTKTITDTVIDQQNVGVAILANDQVTLSATVPPSNDDFAISLASDGSLTVGPNDVRTYTFTYSTTTAGSESFTLEGNWTDDVMEYVAGSASAGYGGATPTVDLVNRRITWDITNFPGNSTASVTWQLRAVSSTGSTSPVSFDVRSRLYTPDFTTPYEVLSHTYQPAEPAEESTHEADCCPGPDIPVSKPMPTPTVSRPVSPTLYPAHSLSPTPLAIIRVAITNITDTTATFFVTTNKPARVSLAYGTEIAALPGHLSSEEGVEHSLQLSGLRPDTRYYVKIAATSAGETVSLPEQFTFRTAARSLGLTLDANHVQVLGRGVLLINGAVPSQPVLLPTDTPLTFILPFIGSGQGEVHVRFQPRQVLGASTGYAAPYIDRVRLLESSPGVFSGQVAGPQAVGLYDMHYELRDVYGNFTSGLLGTLRVVHPFRVVDTSGVPVEAAQVLFKVKNLMSRQYERLATEAVGLQNPAETDVQGEIPIVLAGGQYRFAVSASGYTNVEREYAFSLTDTAYPEIVLTLVGPTFTAGITVWVIMLVLLIILVLWVYLKWRY